MTTKKLTIFCIIFICVFSMAVGVFGKKGLFVNQELRKHVTAVTREQALGEVAISALEMERQQLQSAEALDDIALKLGYNKEGETVYYFPDEVPSDEGETVSKVIQDKRKDGFKGLSVCVCALVAFAFTSIMSILYSVISNIRGEKSQKGGNSNGGDYNDYDIS